MDDIVTTIRVPATRQPASPLYLRAWTRDCSGRAAVERYIHDRFERAYGADVQEFLPTLLGLQDEHGAHLGAVGLRPADAGALFLETYLDAPIEEVIAARSGRRLRREEIVEVGNLAIGRAGGARWLIIALTAYLKAAGYRCVVFTAVPALRNAFANLGLQPVDLAQADGARLGERKAFWGSYYEQQPLVVAGDIQHGFDVLAELLRIDQTLAVLRELWGRAYLEGYAAMDRSGLAQAVSARNWPAGLAA